MSIDEFKKNVGHMTKQKYNDLVNKDGYNGYKLINKNRGHSGHNHNIDISLQTMDGVEIQHFGEKMPTEIIKALNEMIKPPTPPPPGLKQNQFCVEVLLDEFERKLYRCRECGVVTGIWAARTTPIERDYFAHTRGCDNINKFPVECPVELTTGGRRKHKSRHNKKNKKTKKTKKTKKNRRKSFRRR